MTSAKQPDKKDTALQQVCEDDKSRLEHPPFLKQKDFKAAYSGHCFCGAVQFDVSDVPKETVFCHCKSCQRLHSAPSSLNSIFAFDKVQFTKGAEDDVVCYSPQNRKLGFSKGNLPVKICCKHCFSPIGNHGRSMMLIHPTLLEFENGKWPEAYKPSFHQYYKDRVRDINDDLPKFDGKKGDKPINEAGAEKAEEVEAEKEKRDAKRNKEEDEDNEKHAESAKRPKSQ